MRSGTAGMTKSVTPGGGPQRIEDRVHHRRRAGDDTAFTVIGDVLDRWKPGLGRRQEGSRTRNASHVN
jgi:hypothetical protein